VFVAPTFVPAVYVQAVPAVSGVALQGLSLEGCAKAVVAITNVITDSANDLTEREKNTPFVVFNAFIL
jgi:hypothetical protein